MRLARAAALTLSIKRRRLSLPRRNGKEDELLPHSKFPLILRGHIANVSSLFCFHSLILFVSFLLSDAATAVRPLSAGDPVERLLLSLPSTKVSIEFCLRKPPGSV